MLICFLKEAWDDYLYWQNTSKEITRKINSLLKDILREPFEGIGKPEPLRYQYSGFWSRRIDNEHRLVYKIIDNQIIVAQCRFHYK